MAPEKPLVPKVGERYRHYRTRKEYVVMELVLHVTGDRDEWHVVYAAVEPSEDGINHFSRTVADFTGEILVELNLEEKLPVRGPMVPTSRFVRVGGRT